VARRFEMGQALIVEHVAALPEADRLVFVVRLEEIIMHRQAPKN
jgi:hypothetical protein